MDDGIAFLQSRPLIGFQIDGAHLNSVLQGILKEQQHLVQEHGHMMQRMASMESELQELHTRQRDTERTVGTYHDKASTLAEVQTRLAEVEHAMDDVVRDIASNHQAITAASHDAEQAGQLADQVHRALPSLQESVRRLTAEVESVSKQSVQERRDVARALDELDRQRAEQASRFQTVLQEMQERTEALVRDRGSDRALRQMLEELSDRTDENFKSVEESARAVDAELSRQATEMSVIRADVSALDDATRARLTTLVSDNDAKYQILLDSFHEYERTASEMEEHLVMAGQMLARRQPVRRSPLHAAVSASGGGGGGVGRSSAR